MIMQLYSELFNIGNYACVLVLNTHFTERKKKFKLNDILSDMGIVKIFQY